MALKAEQLKGELTDKVIERVHDRLPRDKIPRAEAFVRRFYAHVPPDDLMQASTDELYGAALAILQFGSARPPGEAKIRIYNPTIEIHGWHSGHSVVEIINDDMPFLVDSVTAELNRHGLTVHLVIHPVVRVRRDPAGHLIDVAEDGADGVLERLQRDLRRVLSDVRAAVEDWLPMRERMSEAIAALRERAGGSASGRS